MSRTTFGPQHLVVREMRDGAEMPVFRIVRSSDVSSPEFLDSLRSNYELNFPPRNIEQRATALHMGISTYINFERAEGTAVKFSKLGGFVAQLLLTSGHGFNYAVTGSTGHLTIWADPVKLAETVTDINPVDR